MKNVEAKAKVRETLKAETGKAMRMKPGWKVVPS